MELIKYRQTGAKLEYQSQILEEDSWFQCFKKVLTTKDCRAVNCIQSGFLLPMCFSDIQSKLV